MARGKSTVASSLARTETLLVLLQTGSRHQARGPNASTKVEPANDRPSPRRLLITSWVLIWMSTEHGEGRSFAGSTLVLTLGPRAWWRNPVCSSTKRALVLAREETTVDFPRAAAVGSRLHIERKP